MTDSNHPHMISIRIRDDEYKLLKELGYGYSQLFHDAVKQLKKGSKLGIQKEFEMLKEKMQEIEENMQLIDKSDNEKQMYLDNIKGNFIMFHREGCSDRHNIEWLRSRYGDKSRELGLNEYDMLEYCRGIHK